MQHRKTYKNYGNNCEDLNQNSSVDNDCNAEEKQCEKVERDEKLDEEELKTDIENYLKSFVNELCQLT